MIRCEEVTIPAQPLEALMCLVPSVMGQRWHLPPWNKSTHNHAFGVVSGPAE